MTASHTPARGPGPEVTASEVVERRAEADRLLAEALLSPALARILAELQDERDGRPPGGYNRVYTRHMRS